jgi:hypothetical protein
MRFMTQMYIDSAMDSHNTRIKGPRKIILLYSYTKQATLFTDIDRISQLSYGAQKEKPLIAKPMIGHMFILHHIYVKVILTLKDS